MSFKEKYLRLRERFDRVSATQRQYTTDLQSARNKTRRLKDENNHLLDLLSDIQQMTGSGPTTDSDTSMDDLSDDDDEDDDDDSMRPRTQTDVRTTTTNRPTTTPSARNRKDNNQTGYEGNGHAEAGRDNGQRSNHNGNYSQQDRHDIRLQQEPMQYQPQQQQPQQQPQQPQQQQSSTASSTVNNGSSNMKQERAEGEAPPKQTRRATKRADRGRPRAVVPLKTNPDGTLNYPVVVGRGTNEVIIENMGRIVWNGRGYHNHRYIFPVGFRSKKQYTSLSDTSKKTYFISEILDGGEQPIFQITLEDMPEKVFQHSSSSGAWELALKGLMELGFNAKTHASGPDMYGLTNLGVIKYIQEMPNAHRCRRYMPLKWIVEEDDDNADSSSHAGSVGPGSKSPGRKKKINNSLYASNHEVLVSTMEEARNKERDRDLLASKPYQVRKYTKRKPNPPPAPPTDPFVVSTSSSMQAQSSPRERIGYREEEHQGPWMNVKQESTMDTATASSSASSSSNMAYSDRMYMEPQRVPLLSPSQKESAHHHHHPHHHHQDQHYRPQHRGHPHDNSIHEP
ncbi:hypothetical protein EMPS_08293 [Entomortierella parvispora]|uniref:INO80 complex subunit 3 N-terminal domain-containing protein n=1 Tax=Entomortierella parvispora TaxID=205924 RepID=A0A9P3HG50_9FUNG|nr:hypothetical protein EMPS_08293 [Entomortierella parvispora]